VDVGSVWFELRMDMPGMARQAAAQLEKGQNPGVFNGSIRPTGQGEWHASVGYENRQGKNSASFALTIAP
jgi:hemolysin activation/secretion protein